MVQREDGDQRAMMSGLFRKILKTVWVLINIVVLIALALSAWDMHRNRRAAHFIAWFVAGVFVLLAGVFLLSAGVLLCVVQLLGTLLAMISGLLFRPFCPS